MKNMVVFILTCLCAVIAFAEVQASANNKEQDSSRIDLADWQLVWQDEFDYANEALDRNWESQNGPSGHILCSRWRENAVVEDGMLKLINRKEQRGGQDWTSGSIWTKRKFKYGYFECRYRYAAATGTNNSFWLMTRGPDPAQGKRFEIDINEGHFPNEVNTNIHNWGDVTMRADGKKTHPSHSKSFARGVRPDYSLPLEIPITARKIRLSSNHGAHFHIRQFRIFNVASRYPDPLAVQGDQEAEGLVNHALDADVKVSCSGLYNTVTKPEHAVDNSLRSSWISQREARKWLELTWPKAKRIGCIQFVNGWRQNGNWHGLISDYRIQYHDGQRWLTMARMNVEQEINLAETFHTYGLAWTEDELVFYFDGVEIRREVNTFCHSEVPIWLSLAVIPWAGQVTDAIDGTSMKVDWVRYYQKKKVPDG